MLRKSLILIVLSLAIFRSAFAGQDQGPDIVTLHLKTGGRINGVIIQETEEGMIIDPGYGTVVMSKSEIERIVRPETGDKQDMLRSWRRKKIITERAGASRERKRNLEEFYRREEENIRTKRERAERVRKEKEHRISFTDSSKIVVDAVLNGEVETLLLVDTGANSVLIPMDVAEKLRGAVRKHSKTVKVKLADGTVREGVPFVLGSVEINGIKAENVDAIAMDMQDMEGRHGLLGMSFLNKFYLKIDFENNELILKKK
ncbi:MAG: retropepsin-like aspartic protease [Candidatus Omnitrophota bacterium]